MNFKPHDAFITVMIHFSTSPVVVMVLIYNRFSPFSKYSVGGNGAVADMVREGRCSPGRRVHHRRWGKTAPYPPDVIENMGHNRTRLDRTGIFGYEDKMWVGIPGRLTRYSARARPDCDDMTFNCHTGPSTPQNGRNRRLCARFTALAVLFWCCVFLTGALGQTISDNITSVGPGMVGVRIEERTVSETPPVDSISGGQIKPPALLDSTASYTISSDDDPNYVTPRCPSAVYRKTRPIDHSLVGRELL